MTAVDFYRDLSSEPPDTIDLNGGVLIHKNKNKWHLCKKAAANVTHACGNGGPPNPDRTSMYSDDKKYYERALERSSETVTPAQALEKNRVCSFCERILEDEFNLERVVIATTATESHDVKRFREKREDSRNS
jgi:hypothetical protein